MAAAGAFLFRTGMIVYLAGLATILARRWYAFDFFLLSLRYPVADWAIWATVGGVTAAAVVGLFALATARRRLRKRVWLGWAFMSLAGIAAALALNL